MAVKNKARDRDINGRIKRKYTGPGDGFHPNQTPGWWANLYMNRPKRRANKRVCQAVLAGADPDALNYPLGGRKPHIYYW